MSWLVQSQGGEPEPARITTQWIVQYRATNGAHLTTKHETRAEAFSVLADSLLASALVLWELDDVRHQEAGDRLVRHALRLNAEAESEDGEGYLLRLSQGRKWVVTSI